MKMKLMAFLAFVIFLIFPRVLLAAGSISVTSDSAKDDGTIRVITITAVADASDGSFPVLTLNNTTTGINRNYPLTGMYMFQVIMDGDHGGAHDGADNASVMTDSNAGFDPGQWVGYTITNSTDGSSGTITANTESTVTATLSGGTQNDWDAGDVYQIAVEPTEDSDLYIYQNGRDILEGGGVDRIDNTTENSVYCLINGSPATQPVIGDLAIVLTQAAVATNSAVVVLKLLLF